MFLVVLAAIDAAAYAFVRRSTIELLQPLLALPEGQIALGAALRRVAVTIALFDVPLIAVVGIAAYVLATISVRPLLEARRREERFAADAAHELRTPLATISAIAQAAPSDALAQIGHVALDASALLGDLLFVMRADAPPARMLEPVDLGAVVRRIAAEVQSSRPSLSVRTDAPAALYAVGDERAIERLVRNLAQNAARHARSTVSVRARDERGTAVLVVEDDGAGIAPALRPHVFERFVRSDEAGSGAGLGLAICRQIASAHQGTIELEGANRFVVRLPAAGG